MKKHRKLILHDVHVIFHIFLSNKTALCGKQIEIQVVNQMIRSLNHLSSKNKSVQINERFTDKFCELDQQNY